MKNLNRIVVVMLILAIANISKAMVSPPPFTVGETLTVFATSGLKLRATPASESLVLDIIDYGSEVKVLELDTSNAAFSVEWATGNWVKVEFEGTEGYLFNGFMSNLPLPEFYVELEPNSYAEMIEYYAFLSFHQSELPDTLESKTSTRVFDKFEEGHVLVRKDFGKYYETTLKLKDVRIMDAYHLFKAMLMESGYLKAFNTHLIFKKDNEGNIYEISDTWGQVIKITKAGEYVKLSAFHKDGC
jgi:hypothetical protein